MERSVGELSREVAIELIKDEWAGKERASEGVVDALKQLEQFERPCGRRLLDRCPDRKD
jgi:hypothetical protein